MIVIREEYCSKINKCLAIEFCPVDAISHIPGELPRVDNQKCINCLKCLKFCPAFAQIIEPESKK